MSKKKKFCFLLKLFLLFSIVFLLGLVLVFIYYARDLPRPEKFTERELIQSTKIYDRTGEVLLYDIYGEEKRQYVSIEEVPEHLKLAVLAAEDSRFYNHIGLDVRGVARAFWENIKTRRFSQGGSTISQQLIRSSFLTTEKTFERKIKELILTIELENRHSKEDILEWYLNQIPLGSNSYGVGSASEIYFNKHISEVSIAESAILASLIKSPSFFSPYGPNRDELFYRKEYILGRMKNLNYISEEDFEKSIEEDIYFHPPGQTIKAPHFTLNIKSYLEQKYGEEFLKQRGLKVYTTLDWDLQKFAEETIKEGVEFNKNQYNAHNASLVAIDPKSGEILSLVGSKNYFEDSYPEGCLYNKEQTCLFNPYFNVAVSGNRQPGSAFKPFVYAEALRIGLTPKTILWDVETEFNTNCNPNASQNKDAYGLDCYNPRNYDGFFRGPISIKDSLAQSLNLPSVKLLHLVGIDNSIRLAERLGISTFTSPSRYGLSLVLGGGEVKLLEMVSAYGVFANEGLKTPPLNILKIEDSDGNIIEKNTKTERRILDVQTTRIINDILSDNKARSPMFGSNSLLYFPGQDVAAKTGTTSEYKDAWVFGYTKDISVGVWVGNNDNTPMSPAPAISIGGHIWRNFTEEAVSYFPKNFFEKPEEIETDKQFLKGFIDKENPKTILSYLKGEDFFERDIDEKIYSFWEFGLERWLESNSF